jgi:orotate phosphoribosyltransferase
MATEEQAKLLNLLVTHAYAFRPEGFVLASGKVSTEYLDCRMALSHGEALPALGRLFLSHAHPGAVAIGGLTMGADPIAMQTAAASATANRSLCWFSVRKDAKEHGKKKVIEGDVSKGDNVIVVDDVATTGGSTIQAIEKCRAQGLQVVQVLVLVDREEGGLQNIEQAAGPGVEVVAMFTKSQVRQEWESRRGTPRSIA